MINQRRSALTESAQLRKGIGALSAEATTEVDLEVLRAEVRKFLGVGGPLGPDPRSEVRWHL